MSHTLLNYAFLLFWSKFWEIHGALFFLVKKVTISETSTEILRKFFFFTILTKTVFLHKMSDILLNYAFLLFWSILRKIHRELFFLLKKVAISETSTEILRKFVFFTMFEGANPEENLDLFKQLFLIKPVKGDKY